jgi:hypothetical protein
MNQEDRNIVARALYAATPGKAYSTESELQTLKDVGDIMKDEQTAILTFDARQLEVLLASLDEFKFMVQNMEGTSQRWRTNYITEVEDIENRTQAELDRIMEL